MSDPADKVFSFTFMRMKMAARKAKRGRKARKIKKQKVQEKTRKERAKGREKGAMM